jgi:hypothetical protein
MEILVQISWTQWIIIMMYRYTSKGPRIYAVKALGNYNLPKLWQRTFKNGIPRTFNCIWNEAPVWNADAVYRVQWFTQTAIWEMLKKLFFRTSYENIILNGMSHYCNMYIHVCTNLGHGEIWDSKIKIGCNRK